MRPTLFVSLAACVLLANCAPASVAGTGEVTEAAPPARAAAAPAEEAVQAIPEAQLACLAEAIYFEARGTTPRGQAAVAHVVLNRAESPKFPNSICGVVADRCQFSYRCNGKSNALTNAKARAEATRIASDVLSGAPDPTDGALFFHSARVAPGWFRTRARVGEFGGNVFYR